MKISDIGFLKTEPNRPQNSQNRKLGFRGLVFKNRYPRFRDSFSRFVIHISSYSMIRSTVKVFFFMPYLCISNTESLRLTISRINSAQKYTVNWKPHSVECIHNQQLTEQKPNRKTETAVNLVKPKRNRKPQFFPKPNRKPNQSHFLLTAHPYLQQQVSAQY